MQVEFFHPTYFLALETKKRLIQNKKQNKNINKKMKHKQKQKTKRAMMKSIMYFLRQTKLIASKVKTMIFFHFLFKEEYE